MRRYIFFLALFTALEANAQIVCSHPSGIDETTTEDGAFLCSGGSNTWINSYRLPGHFIPNASINAAQLNVEAWTPGIYIVQVLNQNNTIFSQKLSVKP